jgi:RNA polymerase sigma-70 factor (ECF subfamily)
MRYGNGHMERDDGSPRHTDAAASPHDGVLPLVAPTAPPDDDAIRVAIDRGDHRTAIDRIDDVHGDALYRFVRHLMGADDRADDLYQTTLLAAYRDLGSFAGRSSVRTWLFGIARHRCLDALKADRRQSARFVSSDDVPEVADGAAVADQQMTRSELVAALEDCLDRLAPEVRMVLLLRFQEGFGYDDIVRITRASSEALRARVSRALPVLRRCIETRGAP